MPEYSIPQKEYLWYYVLNFNTRQDAYMLIDDFGNLYCMNISMVYAFLNQDF
jgi:hypothetical protein